ncbi:MAG TPA: branched-chain amino acid ABC transporter permease [Acidimicrobiia bacterium]|jgi:branched-chain amino acid transport system permease protein
MADVEAPAAAVEKKELLPPPELDLRRAVRLGLSNAAAMVLVAATGIVGTFQGRLIIDPFLPLGLLFLYLVAWAFGWLAAKPPTTLEGFAPAVPGPRNLAAGALTGAIGGAGTALLLVFMTTFNLRAIFLELSPQLADTLSFGMSVAAAVPLIVAVATAAGLAGAAVHFLAMRWRRAVMPGLMWVLIFALFTDMIGQFFGGVGLEFVTDLLFTSRGGPLTVVGAVIVFVAFSALYWYRGERKTTLRQRFDLLPADRRTRWTVGLAVAVMVILWFMPRIMGPFVSQVLDNAGIYLLMALGLNIVLGYAGLLDLGYVAFFAVGAYTAAILTSPLSPAFSPELTLIAALPFVMIAAAIAGVIVATPVLRMRGDYLAIVTLGFGEIARILLNSAWLAPYFGGAQGITNIPDLQIGPLTFRSPQDYFIPIFLFVVVAAYITLALQKSRWGRAWMAMREDESVAEAMGINIVTAKLSAFVVGAVLASFGGALFGSQIGSVFPHSFDIVVSITVLVIIIVGGMGSVPGVTVGALALIALPNLLREFSEYQFLFYGVLLIAMMLVRPEGFIPSKRRAQELHTEELAQDAWLEIYSEARTTEPAAEGSA